MRRVQEAHDHSIEDPSQVCGRRRECHVLMRRMPSLGQSYRDCELIQVDTTTAQPGHSIRNGDGSRQFLIVRRLGRWRAKSLGRFGPPYSSEARAISSTIERIEKARRPATVARFTKEGAQILWSLGQPSNHLCCFVASEKKTT